MEEILTFRDSVRHERMASVVISVALLLVFNTQNVDAQTAVASNSGPICTSGTVMLYETGGDAVSWEWRSSGAAVFNDRTIQNPSATGAVNGEVFTVVITDVESHTATATTVVTVFTAAPERPGLISGDNVPCVNATGVVYSVDPVVNATSYFWEVPTGVEITSGQGTVSITVNFGSDTPTASNIRAYAINACGTSTPARNLGLTVTQLPVAAGPITGSPTFTAGTSAVAYTVATITNATSYSWSYSGTGVTINGNGTATVTLDFAISATPGQLRVFGTNTCGEGAASTLDLTLAAKTLALSSVLLEGLYAGSGIMRQAWNETGPQFAAGVADQITIELHDANNYATIVWALPGVALSTSGSAEINIPAAHSGSYYISVRHRNSITTISAQPVSFVGSTVTYSFAVPASVYGANLKAAADNYYLIYGGDANQDGAVDTGDYVPVVNDASRYTTGYTYTDLNGSGSVDTGDYIIMVNNGSRYIRARTPY